MFGYCLWYFLSFLRIFAIFNLRVPRKSQKFWNFSQSDVKNIFSEQLKIYDWIIKMRKYFKWKFFLCISWALETLGWKSRQNEILKCRNTYSWILADFFKHLMPPVYKISSLCKFVHSVFLIRFDYNINMNIWHPLVIIDILLSYLIPMFCLKMSTLSSWILWVVSHDLRLLLLLLFLLHNSY